jgi:hypothetical protein
VPISPAEVQALERSWLQVQAQAQAQEAQAQAQAQQETP